MQSAAPVGFRLSPLQKAMWSRAELRAATVAVRATVPAALDLERLRKSFEREAMQHESLRTVFQVTRGFTAPFQIVEEVAKFGWTVVEKDAPYAWPAAEVSAGPTFSVLVETGAAETRVTVRALALCADVTSLGVMLREVMGFYQETAPAEEAVQYADFSEWHNELLTTKGEDTEAAAAYWAASHPVQALPLRSRGVAAKAGDLEAYAFKVDVRGGDAEATLLGCWQALLWRLTRQEHVTVDVVSEGRPMEELAQSVGRFARPVPLTAELGDGLELSQAIAAAKEGRAEQERWLGYYTGETIGTVGFRFRKAPEDFEAGGLHGRLEQAETMAWPFALSLDCVTGLDGTRCTLHSAAANYSAEDAARMAAMFMRTVAAAVEPGATVGGFALLDEAAEKAAVAAAADAPATAETRPFHELFEAQAALTPDREALGFESETLTYAELNARANQAAHWLRAHGVGPDVPVGLCLPRSAGMIVALLAVLKAGGAYVPLLPDLPGARLAHMIAETGLRTIVTHEPLLASLADYDGATLCLDRDAAALKAEPQTNPEAGVKASDRMYILYTSGSTGTPKGVEVRHANVTNYVAALAERLGLTLVSQASAGMRFGTVSTLGADLGNTAIFPALATGGSVEVIGYETALDGALFAAAQQARKIDVLKITPSNLKALLTGAEAAEVLPARWLITGGEALTWELAGRVLDAQGCALMNHYGPTETTIGCLTNLVDTETKEREQPQAVTVPLGRAIAGMQVYVLDSMLRAVPGGAPGEICIAGAGVTAGYVAREDETTKRFVTNPFGEGRMYRTGDLGRVLPSGAIEFLGRLDDQVKVRGHRVELAEVEAVLTKLGGVHEAVVLFGEDEAGQYLAAYLVTAAGTTPDHALQHARAQLPEYMVPRDYVLVEKIPLSANGKIDRRALAELRAEKTPRAAAEAVAPRNETEAMLAGIWQEALKLERVGVTDNFFDLGGHSLLATQIVARIRTALGLNVSIRMLFESPTVESLALAVESVRTQETDEDELNDLLAELEGLSDAEAEKALGEDAGGSQGRG